MSLEAHVVDPKTLDRLDLPKLRDALRGIDELLLQKLLNLVYQVNDVDTVPHKLDSRTASAITANGATFTCPIDERRIVHTVRINLVTSATVGSRNILITRRNKAGTILSSFINEPVAASTARNYTISPQGTSPDSVIVTLNYPLRLEPEWTIEVDDQADINNTSDTVAWEIDYLRIPV